MTRDDDAHSRETHAEDARLDELFRAGRREMPSNSTRERALARALASTRERSGRRVRLLGGTVALAASAALVMGFVARQRSGANVAAETVPPLAHTNPSPDLPRAARSATVASSDAAALDSAPLHAEKPAVPQPAPTLGDEIAQLEAARSALGAGDPKRALALLDRYARSTRGARLGDEARVLRMDALSQAGRRAEASALARDFVAKNPGSPLVDRARAFVVAPTAPADTGGTTP